MPTPPRPLFLSLLCLTSLMLVLGKAHARVTIAWGSNVNATLFDSNGAALGSPFSFEIGSFGSFVPTASNLDLWSANWHPFDFAVNGTGWYPAFSFISSSAALNADRTSSKAPPLPTWSFGPPNSSSQRGYFWAFNTKTTGAGTEWALITANNWIFPDPAEPGYQLDWRLSNATTIVFGGLNNVEGAGGYSVTPPSFNMQTHQAVPEPGSALLMLFAALAFSQRSRSDRFQTGS